MYIVFDPAWKKKSSKDFYFLKNSKLWKEKIHRSIYFAVTSIIYKILYFAICSLLYSLLDSLVWQSFKEK